MSRPEPFFHHEARRVASEVQSARAHINGAKTLHEVVRAMHVPLRAPFRSLGHLIPELRNLPAFAEQKAESIVRQQIQAMRDERDKIAVRQKLGRLQASDWRLLPGRFPRLARFVQIESLRLARDLLVHHDEAVDDESSV